MPVVSVTRMWSTLGTSIKSDDGKRYTFSQNESYQVTVTVDPPTSADEIYDHPDIPKAGARLAGTTLPIFCKSVSASQQSPILFQIDCTYSGDVNKPFFSPLLQKAQIKRQSISSTEPIDLSWDYVPIMTANFEPIYGLQRDIYDMQYTITKNYLLVNDDLIINYLNSTNSDVWFGYQPGRAKLVGYNAEEVVDDTDDRGDIYYYRVTWTVIVRYPYFVFPEFAWYARNRHEGFIVRAPYEDPEDEPIYLRATAGGQDSTRPVLLKPDGTQLFDSSAAYWQYWKIYNSLPYNDLIGPLT